MSATRPSIAVAALAACAVSALGFSPVPPEPQPQNVFMPGHTYGLGEQQVFLLERRETLTLRYRNDSGDLVSKTARWFDQRSIALTVIGYAPDGSAVLALSDSRDAGNAAQEPANAANADAYPMPGASPTGPVVTADGRVSDPAKLSPLAASNLVLAQKPDEPYADGSKWISQGVIALPSGAQPVRLSHAASQWSGDAAVLHINSTGTFDAGGSARIAEFGNAKLHGNGSVAGTSFVDTRNRLLLGMTLHLTSNGNAAGDHGKSGTYSLSADYTLKLMRWVAGLQPAPAPPAIPQADNIRNGSPDSLNRSGQNDQLTRPAPTDTLFSGSPLPRETPVPLPDVSLPPVPVPVSSGAPLASPVPPPPTPIPTRTPH